MCSSSSSQGSFFAGIILYRRIRFDICLVIIYTASMKDTTFQLLLLVQVNVFLCGRIQFLSFLSSPMSPYHLNYSQSHA